MSWDAGTLVRTPTPSTACIEVVRGYRKCGDVVLGRALATRSRGAAALQARPVVSPGSISGLGDPGAVPRGQWVGGLLVLLGALLREWGQ